MVSEVGFQKRKPTMDVLKPPENMHFDAGNVAEAWRRWEQQFKIYMTAAELSKKAKATQAAILLHTAGPEALDVFSTFQWEEEADKDDTDKVLQKFREYCQPRKTQFSSDTSSGTGNQQEGESIDQWVTDLKTKAATCEFGDQKELMIRDKLIFGVRDQRLKERLLRDGDQSLAKAARRVPSCRKQQTATSGNGSPQNAAGQHHQQRSSTKEI